MNLVLCGPAEESLLATVERLSRPTATTFVEKGVWRFENADDSAITRRMVAAECGAAEVDHAYVEANVRFSDIKLLAIDMDSTLITIECIDELADIAGKKNEVAAITEATMRGEIADFSESLRQRVALLEGLDVSALERVYDERLRLSPGAETLINAARANGAYLLLVSGGFTYFADRLKDLLGFDAAFANQLGITNNRLSGTIEGNVIDASLKAKLVEQALKITRCDRNNGIVVGDGANDIAMMERVNYSIAYHAKPPVRRRAHLLINYGSLATVLSYFSPR